MTFLAVNPGKGGHREAQGRKEPFPPSRLLFSIAAAHKEMQRLLLTTFVCCCGSLAIIKRPVENSRLEIGCGAGHYASIAVFSLFKFASLTARRQAGCVERHDLVATRYREPGVSDGLSETRLSHGLAFGLVSILLIWSGG